jgi:hypothetical protein
LGPAGLIDLLTQTLQALDRLCKCLGLPLVKADKANALGDTLNEQGNGGRPRIGARVGSDQEDIVGLVCQAGRTLKRLIRPILLARKQAVNLLSVDVGAPQKRFGEIETIATTPKVDTPDYPPIKIFDDSG